MARRTIVDKNSLEVRRNPVPGPKKSPVGPLVLILAIAAATGAAIKLDVLNQIDEARGARNIQDQHNKCADNCESNVVEDCTTKQCQNEVWKNLAVCLQGCAHLLDN